MTEKLRGRVVFRSSREVRVIVDGVTWTCELRGRLRQTKTTVVVGDWAAFEVVADGRGILESIERRENWLSRRREVGGGSELVIAANLDRVIAFFAARQPRLKFGALDRLLVAAERQSLPAEIVINKMDLGLDAESERRLELYPELGYPVYPVSVKDDTGLAELDGRLRSAAVVVSGPSGVGKSSLLSRVLGVPIRVGEVSRHNEKGRHTTTAVTWYPLADGGALVDTPGFRDYGLWDLPKVDLAHLMPDLHRHLSQCRFGNCLHSGEPGCGVQAAADAGEISPERLRSYHGILESL